MLFREREFREREQLNKLGIYLLFVQQDGGVIQLTRDITGSSGGGQEAASPGSATQQEAVLSEPGLDTN